MAIHRKCPHCSTWNDEESLCKSCGAILSPELIKAEKEEQLESARAARPISSLDRIVDGLKNSRWLAVRAFYWIGYSVWLVLFGIVSFFIALIAWTPG